MSNNPSLTSLRRRRDQNSMKATGQVQGLDRRAMARKAGRP